MGCEIDGEYDWAVVVFAHVSLVSLLVTGRVLVVRAESVVVSGYLIPQLVPSASLYSTLEVEDFVSSGLA